MPNFICTTCGTQFAETERPPDRCNICQDERQYVGWKGQQWTTLNELRQFHRNSIRQEAQGLIGFGMESSFAIGQRAYWSGIPLEMSFGTAFRCSTMRVIDLVKGIGGISVIAVSHPHFYTSIVEWSRAFDAPTYLHAADKLSVMRPDPAIEFWDGETKPLKNGMTLIRCGGHFDGGTVLHWPEGAEGNGAILSGDILQVVEDRRWLSFMRSYPNMIPLPASAVGRIVQAVQPFEFDRIYGAWWGKVVQQDAKNAVIRSANRYVRAIEQKS